MSLNWNAIDNLHSSSQMQLVTMCIALQIVLLQRSMLLWLMQCVMCSFALHCSVQCCCVIDAVCSIALPCAMCNVQQCTAVYSGYCRARCCCDWCRSVPRKDGCCYLSDSASERITHLLLDQVYFCHLDLRIAHNTKIFTQLNLDTEGKFWEIDMNADYSQL